MSGVYLDEHEKDSWANFGAHSVVAFDNYCHAGESMGKRQINRCGLSLGLLLMYTIGRWIIGWFVLGSLRLVTIPFFRKENTKRKLFEKKKAQPHIFWCPPLLLLGHNVYCYMELLDDGFIPSLLDYAIRIAVVFVYIAWCGNGVRWWDRHPHSLYLENVKFHSNLAMVSLNFLSSMTIMFVPLIEFVNI